MKVSAALAVTGMSVPDQLHYSNTSVNDEEIVDQLGAGNVAQQTNSSWPRIKHRYIVKNKGPSDVKKILFVVNWPA